MLVDSHCHLNMLDYAELNQTLEAILEQAENNGVEHLLCVGTVLSDVPGNLALAQKYPQISISVGLHPNEIMDHEPTLEELITLSSHSKVLAIGETGLDYYRTKETLAQQDRFRVHIAAARELNKPLIIHTRQAKEDTLQILQDEKANEIGGVIHCFTEDWETAKKALDLNFYISFSGIVTFKNAIELQEIAKKVPLDRLLIETDSPFLAPVPYRGKTNQPAYVKYVAEFLATLRGIDFTEVAEMTTQNFYRLFFR